MTIRRRLWVSFFTILVLFASTQAMYLWSSHLRTNTLLTLDKALRRQVIIGSLRQQLDNLNKQVTLLGQIGEVTTIDANGRNALEQQLGEVRRKIGELKTLSEPASLEEVKQLEETYVELAEAWRRFYDYLGVEQSWALAHLVRADPLSQRLLTDIVPRFEQQEQARVREAEANSSAAAQLTDRLSIVIFALSTLLAISVAYMMARRLTRGLGELRDGADRLGGMNLDHRIAVSSRDEIGELGSAFNQMADRLLAARTELTRANDELEQRNREVDQQRQVSESLLLNILPSQVAKELESQGRVEPRYYEDVTILFSDFVDFTSATEKLAAEDLVRILHDYFTAFDRICARYGLEKLKTIGDSYFCVGGLPIRSPSHPVDAVLAAFEMIRVVEEHEPPAGGRPWSIRIGIHTGPVVAGVVGIQKFAFDIWGESVNYASRMESAGAPNRINLSAATYLRVKDFFDCEHRGKVLTKDRKDVDMYLANGLLPAILTDQQGIPPPIFLRRYQAYFQKEPPAFPSFLVTPTRRAEESPTAFRVQR